MPGVQTGALPISPDPCWLGRIIPESSSVVTCSVRPASVTLAVPVGRNRLRSVKRGERWARLEQQTWLTFLLAQAASSTKTWRSPGRNLQDKPATSQTARPPGGPPTDQVSATLQTQTQLRLSDRKRSDCHASFSVEIISLRREFSIRSQ